MDEIVTRIAKRVEERYYGKYRGFVADNSDPEKRGRLRLLVPSILGDQQTGWALPCLPFGGLAGQGFFAVPEKDAQVWIEFEEGDLNRPIWVGTFWQTSSDVPSAAALQPPTTRLLQTPSGHLLEFDDAQGSERFKLLHPAGTEISADENGTLILKNGSGSSVELDAQAHELRIQDENGNKASFTSSGMVLEDLNGNKIEMAASGITIKGNQIVLDGTQVALGGLGGEMVPKGMTLATLLGTHIHTSSSPGGPTSPPMPPADGGSLPTQVLSTIVTVK